MSCWVVPALAAEVLGIPVPQLLERMKAGSVPSKVELGFTLVDVAPNGPRMEGTRMTPGTRPLTYTPIPIEQPRTSAPMKRTTRVRALPLESRLAPVSHEEPVLNAEEEMALMGDGESDRPSRFDMSDWRRTRLATSRSRVRPGTARAA